MLTKADDFPIHQTPDPAAFAGTDRNFYDRYFFNGYNPNGSEFFALAFGTYPNINIADAHFSVVRGGVQYCLHGSRVLHMERMDLRVGPIAIEVTEPLRRLHIRVDGEGITADLRFEGRAFPVQEPRFTHRIGPRSFMDYTRMTQNGRWTGWIEIDGDRRVLSGTAVGTRDRSWGIRPIGAADPQPIAPPVRPSFFWLWAPLNFADFSVFFHVNADDRGRPWNTRAVLCPDGAECSDMLHCANPRMEITWQEGLRHAAHAVLHADFPGRPMEIAFSPFVAPAIGGPARFQMRGIGYPGSSWPHGGYKGELVVAREDFRLDEADPEGMENLHIQAPCRVTALEANGPDQRGIGVLEQLVMGTYAPYGFA
jgi:hypothetical protein